MIILMHEKRAAIIGVEECVRMVDGIATEARIPRKTEIVFMADLPEEDSEGKPIFAFRVTGGEIHYWRGEPITLPTEK
jgi:hypothetical protein